MSSFFCVLGLVLVVSGVGCGASRQSQCESVRDRRVPIQRAEVAKALESVDGEFLDELRRRADSEIAAFQTKFVGECVRHAELDLACFEDTQRARQDDCKKVLDVIWAKVYADVSK